MTKDKTNAFASVWDAIADTPEEAANLRVRADVMSKIAALVEEGDWTQAEAANHCGVTQPRINDLLRGRISRFSLDALVNIAAALGQRVHVEFTAVPRQRVSKRTTASATRQYVAARSRGRRVG
jgi:predicted XRE-type DNA-binding protein